MKYNFDAICKLGDTCSLKHGFLKENNKPADTLALWVADMDFRSPKEVDEAMSAVIKRGIYGYCDVKNDYFDALQAWFARNYGFDFHPSWVVKTPGVVFALCTALKAFTNAGDCVLIQEPVYQHFFSLVTDNDRQLSINSLIYKDGAYSIDMADFEKKLATDKPKLFILCSPHNPVGRVWKREELMEMGRLCQKYGCLVISDEIHCDFVHAGHKHFVYSSLDSSFLDSSIVCTAPSKTFNIPGLQVSNTFIANDGLRAKFKKALSSTGYSNLNLMGVAAATAAYQYGQDWLNQIKCYLSDNFLYLNSFLRHNIPAVKLVEPEATFLGWLDFRDLSLNQKQLNDLIANKAKLWLSDGLVFGPGGEGFQRINLACPRSVLEEALRRLADSINNL